MRKFSALLLILSLILLLSSCNNIEEIEETPIETTAETSQTTTAATTTALTTSETIESLETPPFEITTPLSGDYPQKLEELYPAFSFTADENEFLKQLSFVGDSVCRGFNAYGFYEKKVTFAKGDVATRSIYDYTFDSYGKKTDIISALKAENPKVVVFSMGLNDVNVISKEAFANNYITLLGKVKEALPEAQLFVFSITPIVYEADNSSPSFKINQTQTFLNQTGTGYDDFMPKYTSNTKIDEYNLFLEKTLGKYPEWQYIDVATNMKNNFNALKTNYCGSTDGVHLAPDAYKSMMKSLCEQKKTSVLTETAPEETTAAKKPEQTTVTS